MTISAISVYVSDLAAATRFYTEVLGFEVKQSFGDYATKLTSDGPSLLLCAGGGKTPGNYPSGVVLGHSTKDLDKKMNELRQKGVKLLHDQPEPFPAGRYAAFTDPFGTVHELLEYRS
jgi:lactoylglutathione lyase